MKKKVMSVMVFISVVVFSASLCSAGLLSKKNKKWLEAVVKKCNDESTKGGQKCHAAIPKEAQYYGEEKYYKIWEQCMARVNEIRDKCVEPNQLKVKAKALKELKKIEKAEDKCTKNYEKGIKKCAKKKGKKQISCCEKSFLKINKCLNKVKKMRKKL